MLKTKINRLSFYFLGVLVLLIVFASFSPSLTVEAKSPKKYTISPSTAPCDGTKKDSRYNKYTKDYFLIRSYLRKIEKNGGGTLVLKKGTYKIPAVLSVPSNTTIIFSNGTKIVKTSKTGTKDVVSSETMFQLVSTKNASKRNSTKKYTSSKNVKFIGEGKVTFDLKGQKATGIYMAHNQNVSISGISFKNLGEGSFIRINSCKKVNITSNTFKAHKASKAGTRPAILMDIMCKDTSSKKSWAKVDNTPNVSINITNNSFQNLERAICTNTAVKKVYQKKIKITNNTFKSIDKDAIRIFNCSAPEIANNTFDGIQNGGVRNKKTNYSCIYASGITSPVFTGNSFTNAPRSIQITVGKGFTNSVTSSCLKQMANSNTIGVLGEYTIRYKAKNSDEFTEYWYPESKTTLEIAPSDTCYRNTYSTNASYNKYTKDYFNFLAIMEQFERSGGGTLIVKSGNYSISNEIPIPSNTTIKFESGVTLKKLNKTGSVNYALNTGVFSFVAPSQKKVPVSGYQGASNITLSGAGDMSTVIDLNYLDFSSQNLGVGLGLILCHNSNILIDGITFQNMNGGHFIELDASRNVTIQNCTFKNSKTTKNAKEAINLDTPDSLTGGFSRGWTTYDCTPNTNITIQNNCFENLNRGIGTHSYSKGKFHTGVKIVNNTFTNISDEAVNMMCWQNCQIQNNTFTSVATVNNSYPVFAISGKGVSNITIAYNKFSNINYWIWYGTAKHGADRTACYNYPAVLSTKPTTADINTLKSNTLTNVTNKKVYYSTAENNSDMSVIAELD